jgi:two-component system response regulator PilR (NtrC family)
VTDSAGAAPAPPPGGPRGEILVVDDERSLRELLAIFLSRAGYAVETAGNGAEARRAMAAKEHDLIITDLQMPDASGLDVLAESKAAHPDTQVIVVTAYATADTAIAAMKAGAYDYLVKPFKLDEVGLVVERALERRLLWRQNLALRDEIKGRYRLDRLLGKSAAMQRVFDMLRKIAPARTSVLLYGESGTGKELAARALHELSPRADREMVAINCGAIPETLIESELFGHVKGSFTGATADKRGLFEAAHGGTLFLDEVGELPLATQVKLLRALQERRVKPVGGVAEREVDVRVVAATNRDLETEIEKGTFRQDLYYRLNVIQVRLPPLRERREDIPLLVEHFVRKFSAEMGQPVRFGVDPAAMAALTSYTFPGNVRELENLVERAVTLATGGRITADALPDLSAGAARAAGGAPDLPASGFDLERELETFERRYVLKALERTEGNRTLAARVLGISFRSMRYRLSKLGIAGSEGAGDDTGRPPGDEPDRGGGDPA